MDAPCDLPDARHFVETNPDEAVAYLTGHGVAALDERGELRLVGILIRNDPARPFTVVGEHVLWTWFNERFTLVHTREFCRLAHDRPSFGDDFGTFT